VAGWGLKNGRDKSSGKTHALLVGLPHAVQKVGNGGIALHGGALGHALLQLREGLELDHFRLRRPLGLGGGLCLLGSTSASTAAAAARCTALLASLLLSLALWHFVRV
jgi:hypothetical protein